MTKAGVFESESWHRLLWGELTLKWSFNNKNNFIGLPDKGNLNKAASVARKKKNTHLKNSSENHVESKKISWIGWGGTYRWRTEGLGRQSTMYGTVTVIVQSLSHGWLCGTPWTAARQASLSLTISRSLLKLKSIESVMPPNYLILGCPLLLL